jgi:hypothetical protein
MMRQLVSRLSYANVMASAAMFVALGGGAYAVSVPRNSVGPAQIRTNAVGASEVRTNAVGPREIKRGAVGQSELATGAVGGGDIAPGAIGQAQLGNGSVGAAQFQNGSLARSVLSFSIGEAAANGSVETSPTSVPVGNDQFSPFQGFVSTRLVVREAANHIALLDGQVTVTNTPDDGKATQISVRVVHNGHVDPGVATATVPDGFSDTIPVSLLCNEVPVGDHNFTLEVQAVGGSGISMGSRSLDAASFRPIFNPPN